MTDYIDRQAAIDAVMALMPSLTTADGSGQFDAEIYRVQELFVDIGQVLNDLPSAEAEPVKHGRWGHDYDDWLISGTCSVCGWHSMIMETDVADMSYCPNCGATMDAKEE